MYLVLNIEYTTMKYLGKKLTSICFEIDYFIIIVFEATVIMTDVMSKVG